MVIQAGVRLKQVRDPDNSWASVDVELWFVYMMPTCSRATLATL